MQVTLNNLERDIVLRAINVAKIPNVILSAVIAVQDLLLDGRDWLEVTKSKSVSDPEAEAEFDLSTGEMRAIALIAELALRTDSLEGMLALPLERLRLRLQAQLAAEETAE